MFDIAKLKRNVDSNKLFSILNQNMLEDMNQTIIDCFYIRDYKNGKGKRRIGRLCFNWIANVHPIIFLHICKYIPQYGRWDDLLYITNPQIKPLIYEYINAQIIIDELNMKVGAPVSTCAKWLPTEGKSFARHHKNDFVALLTTLKTTPKTYRYRCTALRSYINNTYHTTKHSTKHSTKNNDNYVHIINKLKI